MKLYVIRPFLLRATLDNGAKRMVSFSGTISCEEGEKGILTFKPADSKNFSLTKKALDVAIKSKYCSFIEPGKPATTKATTKATAKSPASITPKAGDKNTDKNGLPKASGLPVPGTGRPLTDPS